MKNFTENKPAKCTIGNINRLDVIDGHGKHKQINIYRIKDIQNGKVFFIKNSHLDYLQQSNHLDLNQVYDIKQLGAQIKFNLSNEAALRKIFKDQIIAEELTKFKESLKTKYVTDKFVNEYTGNVIKFGTSSNNKKYILLKDKESFKKIQNDEIISKLKNANIQAESYISVIVPINRPGAKKIETNKNIIEVAKLDKEIEQKIDLRIKNLLIEKYIDLSL